MKVSTWATLVAVATLLSGNLGCEKRSAESSKFGPSSEVRYSPMSLEQLDSWHGVRVIKVQKENRLDCQIAFPVHFGASKEEFDVLVYLIENRIHIRRSSDCDASNAIYHVLNQILQLALREQSPEAGAILLEKGGKAHPFNFDGEVAETYAESYLLPVLEGFNKLDVIANANLAQVIAREVCSQLVFYEDVKNQNPKQRVQALLKSLPDRGGREVATQLESQCSRLGIKL